MSKTVPWIEQLKVAGIHFEPPAWRWSLGAEAALITTTPWRLIANGVIAVGDCDHEQLFALNAPFDSGQRAYELVKDRVIVMATIDDLTADLRIEFSDDVFLELFNPSSTYEGWHLTGPNGQMIDALGGGELVTRWGDA